jgi:hypothetical protein
MAYSVDLSAAFDVFRPDIFIKQFRSKLSHGLAFAISDFLYGRKIACDVAGSKSEVLDMPVGCVQGSTLGPRLFALYMGQLAEEIGHEQIVGFADDTYIIINGKSIKELQQKTDTISTNHVKYLESLGMVVNKEKTEAIIFRKNPTCVELRFAGTTIQTTNKMKALGVTLSHNLSWEAHVTNACNKANAKLSLLRKIRCNLTMDQFLQVASSQIFGMLYYAAPLWLNQMLGHKLWRKLESLHYRILRVACNDFKRTKKNQVIDSLCKRATPRMWSTYAISSIAMKIIRDEEPTRLHEAIIDNMVIERRKPRQGHFFDCSKLRIGKYSISNRLTDRGSRGGWTRVKSVLKQKRI